MNNQGLFNTPEQEATLLAGEIREIKEILRDLSRKLTRIEGRAKRAFPSAFPKAQLRAKGSMATKGMAPPTMTVEQVIRVFDAAVQQAKGGNLQAAREQLEALAVPDLNLLRIELGASIGKRKPSRPAIMEAILGRVNESVMLTKHTNRQELIGSFEGQTPSEQLEKEQE